MANSTNNKEFSRVQIPALVHLTRIGYTYFGKISDDASGKVYDPDTNILLEVFKTQFENLNPEAKGEFNHLLEDIKKELGDDTLGRKFYERLRAKSPYKLIDYDNPNNNTFHCTAEFTCKNGDDEFRPDITLFVNGLPLVFVEVKQPNNTGGITAEADRMNSKRLPNKKFRRFINITQLMLFSNNMEYTKDGGIVPVQGVFYCTAARQKAFFNCFREENPKSEAVAPFIRMYPYKVVSPEVEKRIMFDFNHPELRENEQYKKNCDFNSPTNRVLTSMCSPERLLFILKYGIAYVHREKFNEKGEIQTIDEKHIMRYQQLFAAMAITEKLNSGIRSGIIWHTQGSGKTALSYYLTRILKDYYAKQGIVAKFYFIVDRIDLLVQAQQEFEARGLKTTTAKTKKELMQQFREVKGLEGNSGVDEITVVNIQRFASDKDNVDIPAYGVKLQRIFIMDEAHRSYNPKGSFLANLFNADKNSIKIALTGTPLIGEERSSCQIFGDYIHAYYYDRSIEDGYTLKIIREDIETSYKEKIKNVLDQLEAKQKEKDKAEGKKRTLDELAESRNIHKQQIIEHDSYVKELLRYILNDLNTFRMQKWNDPSLGGMIICETSGQAKNLFAHFDEINSELGLNMKAGLILHDQDDKEFRAQVVKDFKSNYTVDILIVFNMLLTGFDAPRLKRLYFGRKLKDHNLLQSITRVNRPYKQHKYGYIVDFADIRKNFDQTNEAYMQELNRFSGVLTDDNKDSTTDNAPDMYKQVMAQKEDLVNQMKEAKQDLFDYTINDTEEFTATISEIGIEDKDELLKIRKALETVRDTSNLIYTFGDDEFKEEFKVLDIDNVGDLLSNVNKRIEMVNQMQALQNPQDGIISINDALYDLEFVFSNLGEEELKIIDGGVEINQVFHRILHEFDDNIDKEDVSFTSLYAEFQHVMQEHGFKPESIAQFNEAKKSLDEIYQRIHSLNRKNAAILSRYRSDKKFVCVHKRIGEVNYERLNKQKSPMVSKFDDDIVSFLNVLKQEIDQKVYDRNDILKQDAYFEKTVMQQIAAGLQKIKVKPTIEDVKFISERITKQYVEQYNETYKA